MPLVRIKYQKINNNFVVCKIRCQEAYRFTKRDLFLPVPNADKNNLSVLSVCSVGSYPLKRSEEAEKLRKKRREEEKKEQAPGSVKKPGV
jgi:hypothetical protein